MRLLFVAVLHHPEELRAAIAAAPPGQTPPLFPPSASQYFWEKALRKRGHTLDVFFRDLPAFGGDRRRAERHSQAITPQKIVAALWRRFPPQANPDYRIRNRRLIDKVREFKPDVLWIVGDNRVIYPETLATIKQIARCKIVYTSGTSPIVFASTLDKRAAPYYDLALVSDYYHGIQWLELGAKRMEALPLAACDPDFHHPYSLTEEERKAYQCDIAFVGTLVPDNLYSRRVQALEALQDFDLGIWSVHDVPSSLRRFVRGSALGEQMLRILSAAKLSINVHGNFVYYGGNMRLFEEAGTKIFQIADDLPGVRQWFGDTLVTYRDMADLREKVAYYLNHDDERNSLVARTQAHVYQEHTYDVRAARFEELLHTID